MTEMLPQVEQYLSRRDWDDVPVMKGREFTVKPLAQGEYNLNFLLTGQYARLEPCLRSVKELIATYPDSVDDVVRLEIVAIDCFGAIRAERLDELQASLDQALELMRAIGQPNQFRNQPSACMVAEAAVLYYARGGRDAERYVKRAMHFLDLCTRPFPIAQPRALFLRGHLARLRGGSGFERRWRKALELARTLDMRYDEARVLHSLLEHGELATAERDEHRERLDVLLTAMDLQAEHFTL